MASLGEIRKGIRNLIKSELPELVGYERIPDVAQVPCFVVAPTEADFALALNRGVDKWSFDLYVLVARTDTVAAQQKLDDYISGSGEKSIRRIVFEADEFVPGSTAFITGMSGYGGSFEAAKIEHVGAVLKLEVHTPGRE